MKNYYSHPIYPIPDPAPVSLGNSVESEKGQGRNRSEQTYEVIIPEHMFGRELSRFYQAKSSGAAKYQYWLDFADAYGDMKFGEFVTKVKCKRAFVLPKAIESTALPQPKEEG